MIPWSGYCAADLRGTVKCDRTISLRFDLKGRGMKGSVRSATNQSAVPLERLALDSKKRSLSQPTQSTLR